MYRFRPAGFALFSIAAAMIGAAHGQDAQLGAEIVRHGTASGAIPCTICHGSSMQGNAAMGAPALAGASQAQTLSALAAIAAGAIGANNAMQHEAHLLTPSERKAVADYLRSLTKTPITLPAIAPNGGETPGIVQLSIGADIVQFGTPSGVKPCTACHGSILQGDAGAAAPALAGEPKSRMLAALDAMAAGKSGKDDAMRKIARLLTPAQREAVAAYVERVTPLKRQ
jgi:cytochrome c553